MQPGGEGLVAKMARGQQGEGGLGRCRPLREVHGVLVRPAPHLFAGVHEEGREQAQQDVTARRRLYESLAARPAIQETNTTESK